MKRISRLVPFVGLLIGACGGANATEAETNTCASGGNQVLMFLDRSASSKLSTSAHAVFQDSIRSVVLNQLECQGDAVHAFLVHAKTRGKSPRVDVVDTVAAAVTKGSKARRLRDQTRRDGHLETLKKAGIRDVVRMLDSTTVPAAYARRTDLLGTLEVISEQLSKAPAGGVRRVYYFSDMFESMDGPGRRNFDRRAPRDRAEAEVWAKQDAATVVKQFNVNPKQLESAEYRIVLGDLANKDDASAVKFYWLSLFGELGVPAEKVHYN